MMVYGRQNSFLGIFAEKYLYDFYKLLYCISLNMCRIDGVNVHRYDNISDTVR